MPDIFFLLIITLFGLAITDLIVGVSNDAVNFLNSAIGSKAAPRWSIMIIASIGIFIGAGFSEGMMEVARKGIFVPGEFVFSDIMIIFIAVMLADIILLDLFNTFGMPTSTTVSIVFELLGASVIMAIVVMTREQKSIDHLGEFINVSKAIQIISGIFMAVGIAFTTGSVIQYFSRILFSFRYKKRLKYFGAVWTGFALTAISYFLIIKGMKHAAFVPAHVHEWVKSNTIPVLLISFGSYTLIMFVLNNLLKVNILKVVVLFGTFALAMAFAGNDLVNFIGVPIAGYQSYQNWSNSGVPANEFSMEGLEGAVPTPFYFLLAAGAIMVATLWFSKKARSVTETEVNLGRQNEGAERFSSNAFSRFVVRASRGIAMGLGSVVPKGAKSWINTNFVKPEFKNPSDAPAFDLIRASVNLTVASMLISLATSLKLPLSTTYVSFMVAMGTSLADRAWGRDSATYRVAGVINVIGGWLFTAIIAFTVAGLFAFLIYSIGFGMVGVIVIFAVTLIIRSYFFHKKKEKKKAALKDQNKLKTELDGTIVLSDTLEQISTTLRIVKENYGNVIGGLVEEDRKLISNAKTEVKELKDQNEQLKYRLFSLIKRIREEEHQSSKIYLTVYDLEQDLVQSTQYITSSIAAHVYNVHTPLSVKQSEQLKEIDNRVQTFLEEIITSIDSRKWESIEQLSKHKSDLLGEIDRLLGEQVDGIKSNEYSSKNSLLYFSILLETKDIVAVAMRFVKLYHRL